MTVCCSKNKKKNMKETDLKSARAIASTSGRRGLTACTHESGLGANIDDDLEQATTNQKWGKRFVIMCCCLARIRLVVALMLGGCSCAPLMSPWWYRFASLSSARNAEHHGIRPEEWKWLHRAKFGFTKWKWLTGDEFKKSKVWEGWWMAKKRSQISDTTVSKNFILIIEKCNKNNLTPRSHFSDNHKQYLTTTQY